MKKPQPKQIVVRIFSGSGTLHIFCHTEAAKTWIEQEAIEFGDLTKLENWYYLYVYHTYDLNEVVEYLKQGA